ncbi:ATP-grasp domain-containing protein [Thermopirellula anaerolimosa]
MNRPVSFPVSFRGPNVLIPCGGKWVGHVVHVREAMAKIAAFRDGRVFVADLQPLTPAGCFADAAFQVPPVRDAAYVPALRELAIKHAIGLILPLIDIDVMALAPHRSALAEDGVHVVCPSPELAEICFDKRRFHDFARSHHLAVPRVFAAEELASAAFPLFAKPARGFGSIGAKVCPDRASSEKSLQERPDLVFEEYLEGVEFSVDLYVSRSTAPVVSVVRQRDKVVGGEAYQSHTVRRPDVRSLARECAAALASVGYWGPLNVQIIVGPGGPAIIDVNPRLGSASLLSNAATGGRLVWSILYEASGGLCGEVDDDYVVGLSLTRYLGEVYHLEGRAVRVDPPSQVRSAALPDCWTRPHFRMTAEDSAAYPATRGAPQ